MKRTIVAKYVRESQLPHYCRSAFAKATDFIEMTCTITDETEEINDLQEYGTVLINGKPLVAIHYEIVITPSKGSSSCYRYETKEEANNHVLNILKQFKNWKRI